MGLTSMSGWRHFFGLIAAGGWIAMAFTQDRVWWVIPPWLAFVFGGVLIGWSLGALDLQQRQKRTPKQPIVFDFCQGLAYRRTTEPASGRVVKKTMEGMPVDEARRRGLLD